MYMCRCSEDFEIFLRIPHATKLILHISFQYFKTMNASVLQTDEYTKFDQSGWLSRHFHETKLSSGLIIRTALISVRRYCIFPNLHLMYHLVFRLRYYSHYL